MELLVGHGAPLAALALHHNGDHRRGVKLGIEVARGVAAKGGDHHNRSGTRTALKATHQLSSPGRRARIPSRRTSALSCGRTAIHPAQRENKWASVYTTTVATWSRWRGPGWEAVTPRRIGDSRLGKMRQMQEVCSYAVAGRIPSSPVARLNIGRDSPYYFTDSRLRTRICSGFRLLRKLARYQLR